MNVFRGPADDGGKLARARHEINKSLLFPDYSRDY